MELRSAVLARRSIRSFKKETVPRALIEEILLDARYAPSWGNTQPWEIFVLTGVALDAFRNENREYLLKGAAISPETPMPHQWPEQLKRRYNATGKIVLDAQSISREDKQARLDYTLRMFSLFDAPVLLIVCTERSLPEGYAMLDCGLLVQTICLLGWDRGIGSCILAGAVAYPELLRKYLQIREDQRIVVGMIMGIEDENAEINQFTRERADVAEIVKWIE